MKKLLLVVAMLLIASPVWATVSVTATDQGSGVVEIKYNCSASERVRSFALDISVDSGATIDNIGDFNVGESNGAVSGGKSGYGIFPGRFADYINPALPNWADPNYTPVAPVADPNARTGLGTSAITVEMGSLYKDDVNKPGTSGLLFRLDVAGHGASDCNLSIVLNNTRVGVVLEDTSVVTSPVLTGTKVLFSTNVPCPDVTGMNRVAARAAIIAAGLTVGNEANVAPTVANEPVRTTIGQYPAPGYMYPPGSPMDINVVSYPVKDAAPSSLYANWVINGRPACWAYPRQCRGDADGKKLGTLWVSGNDLILLKAAISKNPLPDNGACSDFDHKKLGTLWVSGNDLNILKAYISKAEVSIQLCGDIPAASAGFSTDANYWYWCNPTSVVCPTGQYCAPAGVCPNTP